MVQGTHVGNRDSRTEPSPSVAILWGRHGVSLLCYGRGGGSEWSSGCEEQNHSQHRRALEFHGWMIHPPPVMSFHCVTLTAGVSLSDPSGHPFRWFWGCSTPVRHLGNWRSVWWVELGQDAEKASSLSAIIYR